MKQPEGQCPDCGALADGHKCQLPRLEAVLDGIELDAAEKNLVRWFARWDNDAINTLIGLFEKCREEVDAVPVQ